MCFVQTEKSCRRGAIAVSLRQRPENDVSFGHLQSLPIGETPQPFFSVRSTVDNGKSRTVIFGSLPEHNRALDDICQLAHIARPFVRDKHRLCRLGYLNNALFGLGSGAPQEIPCQNR